jgi:hypothetical protein
MTSGNSLRIVSCKRFLLRRIALAICLCGAASSVTAAPVALKIHRGANSFKLEAQYKQPTQVWNPDGTLSVWFTSYNTPRAKVLEEGAGMANDQGNITLCFRTRNVEPPYELNAATYPVILEFQLGKLERRNYLVKVLTPCAAS